MKKIYVFLSCSLIVGVSSYTHAMKRENLVTPHQIELWWPEEVIIKIGAFSDVNTRVNVSLTKKLYKALLSIGNDMLLQEDGLVLDAHNRLFYLFYGCIHNLKHLVQKSLNLFDVEKNSNNQSSEGYTNDKQLLQQAHYYIKQLTQSDVVNLLPNYSPYTIDDKINLLDWIVYTKKINLFSWVLKRYYGTVIAYNPDKSPLLTLLCVSHMDENKHAIPLYMQMTQQVLNHPATDPHKEKKAWLAWSWHTNQIGVQITKHFLASDNFNINQIDAEGKTKLHNLYLNTAEDVYTLYSLLTHSDCNINIQNTYKFTPLHAAISPLYNSIPCQKTKKIKILLDHPAINVDVQDYKGDTPLHWAISDNDVESIELLLNKNAQVNIQNNKGNTPLHDAVESGDIKIIDLLLTKSNINIDIQNNEQRTALEVALQIKERITKNISAFSQSQKNNKLRWKYNNLLKEQKNNDIIIERLKKII